MTKEMWNTKIHLGSKVIQIMAGKAEVESHYGVQGRQYYPKIFTIFALFKHIILILDWQMTLHLSVKTISGNSAMWLDCDQENTYEYIWTAD